MEIVGKSKCVVNKINELLSMLCVQVGKEEIGKLITFFANIQID